MKIKQVLSLICLMVVMSLGASEIALAKVYQNSAWDYSFRYPADWVISDDAEDELLISSPLPEDGSPSVSSINVLISEFPLATAFDSLEDLVEVILPYYAEILAEQDIHVSELDPKGISKHGSRDLYSIEMDAWHLGEDVFLEQHFCVMNDSFFVMTLTTMKYDFQSQKPIFDAITSSLIFE